MLEKVQKKRWKDVCPTKEFEECEIKSEGTAQKPTNKKRTKLRRRERLERLDRAFRCELKNMKTKIQAL
ncbi:hypothetical protein RUM43_013356 [Polyplax serrata]|uniref:Uncharacterized protein n=1 Tax=Polyplax serrata TaxID=468196 RepID=A0AAN8P5A2_POLSC